MGDCAKGGQAYLDPNWVEVPKEPAMGYRALLGKCPQMGGSCSSNFEPTPYEPPPEHYPRCYADPPDTPMAAKIYRRKYRTSSQDIGWAPMRVPGSAPHESALITELPKPWLLCKKNECPPQNSSPPHACELPEPRKPGPVDELIKKQGDASSRLTAGNVVYPRNDKNPNACHPEKRAIIMYSPKVFATSYRGLHPNLGPDDLPTEMYAENRMFESDNI